MMPSWASDEVDDHATPASVRHEEEEGLSFCRRRQKRST
jgi:hypothetical protein